MEMLARCSGCGYAIPLWSPQQVAPHDVLDPVSGGPCVGSRKPPSREPANEIPRGVTVCVSSLGQTPRPNAVPLSNARAWLAECVAVSQRACAETHTPPWGFPAHGPVLLARLDALEAFAAAFAGAEWGGSEDGDVWASCIECDGVEPEDYDNTIAGQARWRIWGTAGDDKAIVMRRGRGHGPECKRGAAIAALKATGGP